MKIDPRIEAEQVDRLRAMRAKRDAVKHGEALARIEQAAKDGAPPAPHQEDANLLPLILDAVKAMATVGEISNVLRGVWGEHVETLVL